MKKELFQLKNILILPFVLLISLAIFISNYFTWKYSEQVTLKVGDTLTKQATYLAVQKLDYYLNHASTANNAIKNVINYGVLNNSNTAVNYIQKVVTNNDNIDTLSFAYPNGTYIGITRTPDGELIKKIASHTTNHALYSYKASNNKLMSKKSSFDVLKQEWYSKAKKSAGPVWSSVFAMFGSDKLGISYSEALYHNKQFIGVVGSNIIFHDLNQQLAKISLSKNSLLFIIDEKNQIIAQNNGETGHNDRSLIKVIESNNDLLKQSLGYIKNNSYNNKKFYGTARLTVNDQSANYLIRYIPYSHGDGMNWHIGVVIPKNDLLGDPFQVTKQTYLIWLASFIITTMLGLIVSYLINSTLKKIRNVIKQFDPDSVHTETDHVINDIDDLSSAFSSLSQKINDSYQESRTDALTGLDNKRSFDSSLEEYWTQFQEGQLHDIILMTFDIDCFKQFNDTYGHPAGDSCLQDFSQVLQEATSHLGFIYRVGGEEFAIILLNDTVEFAMEIANVIIKNLVAKKIPHKNSTVADYVTTSIGIASAKSHKPQSKYELIVQADTALYRAKSTGRNRYAIY